MGLRGAAIVSNKLFLILLLSGITFLAITSALKTSISDAYCAEAICRQEGRGNLDACFNNDYLFCCGVNGTLSCGSYNKCYQITSSTGLSQCSVIRIISWITLSIGTIGLIGSILIAWQTKPNSNQGFSPYSQNQIYS
jgi:hypothetical protein